MKKLLSFLICCLALNASAITPFTFLFKMGDGTANTNVAWMQYWPPQNNTITVVGTNIVFGGSNIVLTPDVNGFGSNAAMAGSYRIFFPNLNQGFFANVADVTNVLPLATYVTAAPTFLEPVNYYSLVTNWLSFPPATNTFIGLIAAIGYTPATNTFGGVTWALGYVPPTNSFAGLTNALLYMPATNSFGGIVYALGYTPLTNSLAAISNALTYLPATNNGVITMTQLGFQPATNSFTGITTPLGYVPGTNGYIGVSALGGAASIATNGFLWVISYKTNNDPGPQLTNAPMGSMLYTTNGQFYQLSNIVWRLK